MACCSTTSMSEWMGLSWDTNRSSTCWAIWTRKCQAARSRSFTSRSGASGPVAIRRTSICVLSISTTVQTPANGTQWNSSTLRNSERNLKKVTFSFIQNTKWISTAAKDSGIKKSTGSWSKENTQSKKSYSKKAISLCQGPEHCTGSGHTALHSSQHGISFR